MTKWTSTPDEEKTYKHVVIYFNEREAEIEDFEAQSGNTVKQHGFASANTVRETAVNRLLESLTQKDEEKAAVAIKVNAKIDRLGEALMNIDERMNKSSRHRNPKRQVVDVLESNSKDKLPTPIKKQGPRKPRPSKKPTKVEEAKPTNIRRETVAD